MNFFVAISQDDDIRQNLTEGDEVKDGFRGVQSICEVNRRLLELEWIEKHENEIIFMPHVPLQ